MNQLCHFNQWFCVFFLLKAMHRQSLDEHIHIVQQIHDDNKSDLYASSLLDVHICFDSTIRTIC